MNPGNNLSRLRMARSSPAHETGPIGFARGAFLPNGSAGLNADTGSSKSITTAPYGGLMGKTTGFVPKVPRNLIEAGINEILIEDLIFKLLLSRGVLSGRQLAREICLPFEILVEVLKDLKNQMLLAYRSTAGVNDFTYFLTQEGRTKALVARDSSAYVGAAPVPRPRCDSSTPVGPKKLRQVASWQAKPSICPFSTALIRRSSPHSSSRTMPRAYSLVTSILAAIWAEV